MLLKFFKAKQKHILLNKVNINKKINKKTKPISVFTADVKDDCLFKEQFDLWKTIEWNKDIPPYIKRLNNLGDDRSFVILATTILEYQIDRFLKKFIPKYDILIDKNTPLNTKIKILKAFNLLPKQFPNMITVIKDIRNDFAHHLEIDNFNDATKSKDLPKNIEKLKKYWNSYSSEMAYWLNDDNIRLLFKDIWIVCLEGLRVYENNIELFRKETEKEEFLNSLHQLSINLKNDRKKN